MIIYGKLYLPSASSRPSGTLYLHTQIPTAMAELKKQDLSIELPDDIAQGNYSNLVIISHSSSEFIVDFALMLPGLQKAKIKSRIILTPEHAKRLLYSLQDNITRYENAIGKIEIPGTHAADDQTVVNIGPKVGKA